jgi:CubicO group peptidase (beta-lactamase class C family)
LATIEIQAKPQDVGLDPDRLARIDAHFARYVDDGRLPGWSLAVARHGQVAHIATYGKRDVENELAIELDTIFRIYSMTKPITSVALMMLYEEGRFELKDSIYHYLPAFKDLQVYVSGGDKEPMVTQPAERRIKMWHLLSHTSGLTYGFHRSHPVDAAYREAGFDFGGPPGMDLAQTCDAYAQLPLLFEPGSEWNYSVSTDVVGRLVEVLSGQPLDQFLAERIFEPLGMSDTAFSVPEADHDRLAALYVPHHGKTAFLRFDMFGKAAKRPPEMLSGGGGLVSTLGDYQRFVHLLHGGGELDGVRLLGPRTLSFMHQNHLPGNVDLEAYGRPLFSETTFDGVGFGLGFSVTIDPVKGEVPSGVGEYGWGGAASTTFWVDPAEDLTAIFMTQLLPSSTHPIRPQLKQLVAQAIVD